MTRHILFPLFLAALLPLASCSDMLDTDSEMVEFQEDNRLCSPTDSVYSVMGIIHKLQVIADRSLLLGELRADLVEPTAHANADLKAIARFDVGTDNAYNRISDYYAVINNCNYYLCTVDTALERRGRRVFEAEYAAVKAFRAWTYLELAKIYGSVPLVVEPVLTEKQAEAAMQKTPADMAQICNFFISDLTPYVDTRLPNYGSINGYTSRQLFIPVRALLGELCLWAGRYQEACAFYHDYLTLYSNPVTTGTAHAYWQPDNRLFEHAIDGYSSSVSGTGEMLWAIPMEDSEYNGVKSRIGEIYNSIIDNDYYAQLTPSEGLHNLSKAQNYCMVIRITDQLSDTIYAPKTNLREERQEGDLRLYAAYNHRVVNRDQNSRYSSDVQTIGKLATSRVTPFRANIIYLHYAEALNRAGYPQSAMAVLKYGLTSENIQKYIDETEREAAGTLLDFDINTFTQNNTQGVHARGCGAADADTLYVLPQPAQALASRADTVAWQQPLVEDMIVNELALETAFEGKRFYDLMRVALRRGDPAYLADPVSRRYGQRDESLFTLLSDKANWYLSK